MRASFSYESTSRLQFAGLTPRAPSNVRRWLWNERVLSLLLRNEATRIDRIEPPAAVHDLHERLASQLRAYADDLDDGAKLVRSGAWRDEATFVPKSDRLEARFESDASAILATIRAFRRRSADYPKPRMNFASSDILSGVHGGSKVSSLSTCSTPGICATTRSMSSWIIAPAGQPIDVSVYRTLTVGPSISAP
jgi:hypothetical protein